MSTRRSKVTYVGNPAFVIRPPIIVNKFVMGNWGASMGDRFSGGWASQERAVRALLEGAGYEIIMLVGYSDE